MTFFHQLYSLSHCICEHIPVYYYYLAQNVYLERNNLKGQVKCFRRSAGF